MDPGVLLVARVHIFTDQMCPQLTRLLATTRRLLVNSYVVTISVVQP